MFRIKPAARLAITIGLGVLSLVCVAFGLNLIPDPKTKELEGRLSLIRSIASSVSTLAETNRDKEVQLLITRIHAIEPAIASICVKRAGGKKMMAGPHEETWNLVADSNLASNQVAIDLFSRNQKWGSLEIAFKSTANFQNSFAWGLLAFPVPLIAFLFSSVSLVSWYILGKTFQYLNPSNTVPNRVRSALDSIGSGLVMVTPAGDIAHANKSFSNIVKRNPDDIVGKRMDDFQWSLENEVPAEFPWSRCRKHRESISGEIVQAKFSSGVVQKYLVSSTPIFGSKDQFRGILVSFEDVTALEAKKSELAKIIQTVRQSRDEVQRQNEQLHFLANYDSLTHCMNRRSFYAEFERLWNQTLKYPLAIIILDIDHFKNINDTHGHSRGDDVLRSVGSMLNSLVGNRGTVCRYGGEEFTVLLPDIPFEECVQLAEELRHAIEDQPIAELAITTSIGISNRSFGAVDGQQLLDQADQCLYVAKRNGRNQVVRFDQINEYSDNASQPTGTLSDRDTLFPDTQALSQAGDGDHCRSEIEFSSVTGLLSALSFRSRETAEHSVRVAELAVTIGRSFLPKRELYYLEIAALMHDIGKIGVPDSILNKPGPLDENEWKFMNRHNEMGVAIVRNALSNQSVAETIEHYYHLKNQSGRQLIQPESQLCISAEILFVCDAFDSMITESVYRKGMTVANAVTEILAHTPGQFHPAVVGELVEYLKEGRLKRRQQESLRVHSLDHCQPGSESTAACGVENHDDRNFSPGDSELAKILGLAEDVMNLYYENRLQPSRPEALEQNAQT